MEANASAGGNLPNADPELQAVRTTTVYIRPADCPSHVGAEYLILPEWYEFDLTAWYLSLPSDVQVRGAITEFKHTAGSRLGGPHNNAVCLAEVVGQTFPFTVGPDGEMKMVDLFQRYAEICRHKRHLLSMCTLNRLVRFHFWCYNWQLDRQAGHDFYSDWDYLRYVTFGDDDL